MPAVILGVLARADGGRLGLELDFILLIGTFMSIFTGLRRTLVNLFDWANDDFVIEEYALRGGLGLPPRLMFSWF